MVGAITEIRAPMARQVAEDPAAYPLAVVAARAADAKMARDTVVLGVRSVFGVADAFVITSGGNTRQVRTVVDEVERHVSIASGRSPVRVEGLGDARWVLMDYGDFIVHVFLDEARSYYNLERLWSDAERVRWEPVAH
jgi:ribosome-associated protein